MPRFGKGNAESSAMPKYKRHDSVKRSGSVSMEIQGTEAQIDRVILEIEQGRYVKIENMEVRTIPIKEEERGFRIR